MLYALVACIRLSSFVIATRIKAIAACHAHKEMIKSRLLFSPPKQLHPASRARAREILSQAHISSPIFSVYSIPLFRGKIISAENGREKDRDAGAYYYRDRKSVEARGPEISAGRVVLNYDVDKTSEDTSRRRDTYVSLSCFITRIPYRTRACRTVAGLRTMRIINVMRNVAVNSDQRKRPITRPGGEYGRVDQAIGSGERNLRIVAALSCK